MKKTFHAFVFQLRCQWPKPCQRLSWKIPRSIWWKFASQQSKNYKLPLKSRVSSFKNLVNEIRGLNLVIKTRINRVITGLLVCPLIDWPWPLTKDETSTLFQKKLGCVEGGRRCRNGQFDHFGDAARYTWKAKSPRYQNLSYGSAISNNHGSIPSNCWRRVLRDCNII